MNKDCVKDKNCTKPPNCITLRRSKPIDLKSGTFMFNGHPKFSTTGATDNPKIGTTEDWIFYSFLAKHPIHVHLINYQVVG